MAKSLAAPPPAVMWKVENVPDELGGIAEISRQSDEGAAPFFLWLIMKCERRERNYRQGY